MSERFSFRRVGAMIRKEFIQMRRDKLTFAMMIGVPVMQLLLFGYAINNDPKDLPAAVHLQDTGVYARSILSAIKNTGYFRYDRQIASSEEGDFLLDEGAVAFVITVPAGFSEKLMRGERPQLLIEADASDPVAAANALSSLIQVQETALRHDLLGALAALAPRAPPFELVVQRRYNPEGISAYNIVPGLLGVILTMTMVMITGLAVTRETERGTMENILAMPLKPAEVMIGKIVPYIMIGYVQVTIVLLAARLLFSVPMLGSLALLSLLIAVFIAVNLALGFTISTVARSQLQAMQMTFFVFLPSLMLSGFMFPFRGMPEWAQTIGEAVPLTHFLRIVRGILLKGNGMTELWPDLWPLLLFLAAVTVIALNRYRRTLD